MLSFRWVLGRVRGSVCNACGFARVFFFAADEYSVTKLNRGWLRNCVFAVDGSVWMMAAAKFGVSV